MAFFPCIYFSQQNTTFFDGSNRNWINKPKSFIIKSIIERSRKRQYFYELALKLFSICDKNGLRLIVENPYSEVHYLRNNFPYKPKIIDKNRRLRGDYFVKPTQYWFVNCEPTNINTYQSPKMVKRINNCGGHNGTFCDEERSMISPDYARNFICDFILGEIQKHSQLSIFD